MRFVFYNKQKLSSPSLFLCLCLSLSLSLCLSLCVSLSFSLSLSLSLSLFLFLSLSFFLFSLLFSLSFFLTFSLLRSLSSFYIQEKTNRALSLQNSLLESRCCELSAMSDCQRQLESAQERLTKLEAELVSEHQTRRSLEEELNLLREKLKQEERDHCEVR